MSRVAVMVIVVVKLRLLLGWIHVENKHSRTFILHFHTKSAKLDEIQGLFT